MNGLLYTRQERVDLNDGFPKDFDGIVTKPCSFAVVGVQVDHQKMGDVSLDLVLRRVDAYDGALATFRLQGEDQWKQYLAESNVEKPEALLYALIVAYLPNTAHTIPGILPAETGFDALVNANLFGSTFHTREFSDDR